jgi:hypothetical protein
MTLLLLAVSPSKHESNHAADERQRWKDGIAYLPEVCAAGKDQGSDQAEKDWANNRENQRKQYSSDHGQLRLRFGPTLNMRLAAAYHFLGGILWRAL